MTGYAKQSITDSRKGCILSMETPARQNVQKSEKTNDFLSF